MNEHVEHPAEDGAQEGPDLTEECYTRIFRLGSMDLIRSICSAVIAGRELAGYPFREITDEELKNPFMWLFKHHSCVCCTSGPYEDIAEILFEKAKRFQDRATWGGSASYIHGIQAQPGEPEFISLREFIAEATELPSSTQLEASLFRQPDLELICYTFFNNVRHAVDAAISQLCEAVYYGVPLYTQSLEDKHQFLLVPDDHEDVHFLRRKHHYDETRTGTSEREFRFPRWVNEYHLKPAHLYAKRTFFGRWDASHTEQAVEILRKAMRQHIGVPLATRLATAISAQPRFLDGTHPHFAPKLSAAVAAWEAMTAHPTMLKQGKSPKEAMKRWLTQNAEKFGLLKEDGTPNDEGINQCASVANWNLNGGSPKTPGGDD